MGYMSTSRVVTKSYPLIVQPGWIVKVRGSKQSYTFLRHVVNGDEEWIECKGPTGANRAFEVDRIAAIEIPKPKVGDDD